MQLDPQDTVTTFSWQLSLVQAELQTQWEAKCEHLLASAKDEHLQQYQEVCAQRDASQQKLLQLQEKVGVAPGPDSVGSPLRRQTGCLSLVVSFDPRDANSLKTKSHLFSSP